MLFWVSVVFTKIVTSSLLHPLFLFEEISLTVTQIVIVSVSFIPFFQAIHDKDIVAILHLLVALARHFECPLKLPGGVRINTVVVQKKGGILLPQKLVQEITATTEGEE